MNSIRRTALSGVFFLLGLKSMCQQGDYDPVHLYSIAELQKDFKFLRAKLGRTHPNLYLYTPKVKFDLFFDSLYSCITKPMRDFEFYQLITLLNSKIKDGHTMML